MSHTQFSLLEITRGTKGKGQCKIANAVQSRDCGHYVVSCPGNPLSLHPFYFALLRQACHLVVLLDECMLACLFVGLYVLLYCMLSASYRNTFFWKASCVISETKVQDMNRSACTVPDSHNKDGHRPTASMAIVMGATTQHCESDFYTSASPTVPVLKSLMD